MNDWNYQIGPHRFLLMTQHFLLQGYRPITFWGGYCNPHNPHGTRCKVPQLCRANSRCQQVSRHVLLAVTSVHHGVVVTMLFLFWQIPIYNFRLSQHAMWAARCFGLTVTFWAKSEPQSSCLYQPVPPKRRYSSTTLHGVTFQKTFVLNFFF